MQPCLFVLVKWCAEMVHLSARTSSQQILECLMRQQTWSIDTSVLAHSGRDEEWQAQGSLPSPTEQCINYTIIYTVYKVLFNTSWFLVEICLPHFGIQPVQSPCYHCLTRHGPSPPLPSVHFGSCCPLGRSDHPSTDSGRLAASRCESVLHVQIHRNSGLLPRCPRLSRID